MHTNQLGQKLEESDVRCQKVTRKCLVHTLRGGCDLRMSRKMSRKNVTLFCERMSRVKT